MVEGVREHGKILQVRAVGNAILGTVERVNHLFWKVGVHFLAEVHLQRIAVALLLPHSPFLAALGAVPALGMTE